MEKTNKNEAKGTKSYSLSNVSYNQVGEVHMGDKIHQEIHDSSVTYESNISDTSNIESLSIYLTTHFNEKKIGLVGVVSLIAGLLSIISSLNSIFQNIRIFPWMPSFSSSVGIFLMVLGVLFIVFGSLLLNALSYKEYAHCNSCNRDYSYKESKNPTIREVEANEGIIKTKTKYLKCRFCGHETQRKSSVKIPYEEEN